MGCYLTLKWGTLKSWDFSGNNKAAKLLKSYYEIGSHLHGALRRDTPEQKKIICELIDLMPGDICLDWNNEYVSKEKAKEYVMNYNIVQ